MAPNDSSSCHKVAVRDCSSGKLEVKFFGKLDLLELWWLCWCQRLQESGHQSMSANEILVPSHVMHTLIVTQQILPETVSQNVKSPILA